MLTPPSRTLSAATLITSVSIYTGFLDGYRVIYHPSLIFKFPPELWRIPTSFLLTGPKLSMIFDTYFLYRYLKDLEISDRRFPRKEDLVWYLMCVSVGIIVSLPFRRASAPVYSGRGRNLPATPCRETPHLSARIV